MNIKILHSWLSEYLETNAKPEDIAKYLSLCGPSVERLEKIGNDYSYDIEITTNRIDAASVYGIAREAQAILPQFGFKAKLKELKPLKYKKCIPSKFPVDIVADKKLTNRIMAVVIENPKNRKTPEYIKIRLENAGIRSLDLIIDITNYVMTEIGHPTHVFDLDRLITKKIIVRESKKGEVAVGLDGKTYKLPGEDIVFDDGDGKIIDLPGILGTKNSVVTPETKRILFFIDNNDPVRTRKTSMTLSIRSVAATLNEKGVDTELAEATLERGIELFEKECGGIVAGGILDINYSPYKIKTITVSKDLIAQKIGINIDNKNIINILSGLGFLVTNIKKDIFKISIPSWRSSDMTIPEDIVEEIARIYGYFNLPSEIMSGKLPELSKSSTFSFEDDIKDLLKSLGGIEVYTLSLVSKEDSGEKALKLKNALGLDSEYLRTSLYPSLRNAAKENENLDESFHLFEISNIYIPRNNDLPEERLMLAGIFSKTDYQTAKGVVEYLLNEFGIKPRVIPEESKIFKPSSSISFYHGKNLLGEFGLIDDNLIYYEFSLERLIIAKGIKSYIPKSKYPPQIEDLRFEFPKGTYLGEAIEILNDIKYVTNPELIDTYESTATFRVYFHNTEKTLNNDEVDVIRKNIIFAMKTKLGGSLKS
jgi:phenylalanyl-tRNA synthetase beta chain